jgi:hypothetical protein
MKTLAARPARIRDLTPQRNVAARLSMVSELCRAHEALPDGRSPFLPDAVAPHGEWRGPTADEITRLSASTDICGASDILIVALPRLARVLGNSLPRGGDILAIQSAVRDVTFVRRLEGCVDDLIPFCVRPDGIVCQGTWVNPGGSRLVTHNMDLDPPRRIGLHVDNWDDLPLGERARGRRRLCVNLGRSPRYLVFLEMPVSMLVAAGRFPLEVPEDLSPAILVRVHLGKNLQQPAARVRINPGEAYIMNADDVIHDGASDVGDVPDVALHFLGHFGPDDNAAGSQV